MEKRIGREAPKRVRLKTDPFPFENNFSVRSWTDSIGNITTSARVANRGDSLMEGDYNER
jgi:hypothetical protein